MVNLVRAVRNARYKIMVAIDDPSFNISFLGELATTLKDDIVGFKIGLPYITYYGARQLKRIIEESPRTYYLADLKLADVADAMISAVRVVKGAGFHGLVAHAVVGIAGALDALVREVRNTNLDLVLQATIASPGCISTIDKLLPEIYNVVNAVDPTGLIVPANKAHIIREFRERFGWRYVILSSDIMVYNVIPGDGLCAGADAEIIGKSLLAAPDPLQALRDVAATQEEVLRKGGKSCLTRPQQ